MYILKINICFMHKANDRSAKRKYDFSQIILLKVVHTVCLA